MNPFNAIAKPYESVLIAHLPKAEQYDETEAEYDGRQFRLMSVGGVVVDAIPEDAKGARWWQVRIMAREADLAAIAVTKTDVANFDFTIGTTPRQPGTVLAARLYTRGPWVTFKEQA